MRAFGFFAAFTAITSVFAAPLAAPKSDSVALQARDAPDVSVAVGLGPICLQLHVDLTGIVAEIDAVLDVAEDTVEDVVEHVTPLVNKLVVVLQATVTKVTTYAVGNVNNVAGFATGPVANVAGSTVNSAVALTLGELVQLLIVIQTVLVKVLCRIATLIGRDHADLAALLSKVICLFWNLTQAIIKLTGNLSLPSLLSAVGPIITATGITIPNIN